MIHKSAFALRLVSILAAFAMLNSGCDLLDTILRAVARACDAPEIVVSRTDDTVSGLCNSGNCSLRQAVTTSNDCPGTQTIRIPAGTYSLTHTGAGEDINQTGDLDITDSVNILGVPGPYPPYIDGNHGDRIFDIRVGTTVSMTDLIIEYGNVSGDGGGILNNGNLEFARVILDTNTSSLGGGGIMNLGELTASDLQVLDNQAASGGGIQNEGTVTLEGARIEGNLSTAHTGEGGGIWNRGHLQASRVDMRQNSSGLNNEADATFSRSAFVENTLGTSGLREGARNTGTLNIENVTISGNYRAISNAGELHVSFSTIAGNTEGILSFEESHPHTISNSIVAGNSSANCSGQITSTGYNIDTGNTCGFAQASDLVNTDPLLQPLTAELAGETFIHRFDTAVPSPALDSADPAHCSGADQLGTARPQGTACDRGAWEANTLSSTAPLVIASATPTPAESPTPGAFLLLLNKNSNCRSGPGTAYPSVDAYPAGQSLQVDGQSETAPSWWQVLIPNSRKHCWISSASGQPGGDPSLLPVIRVAPPPTATPKPGGIDFDKDGYPAGPDCNDKNAKIHPGAGETPNDKVDSNCNGDDDT